MLTFNVIFQCRPGERETFLGELRAAGIDAASRAEPGNRGYDFYLSVNDPDALLLIEKYTEDAAVFAHAQQGLVVVDHANLVAVDLAPQAGVCALSGAAGSREKVSLAVRFYRRGVEQYHVALDELFA